MSQSLNYFVSYSHMLLLIITESINVAAYEKYK
jgi:hypothetical protein